MQQEQDVRLLGMVKGGHRYVFLWTEQHTSQLLNCLGHYADDDRLNLSWYDAAVLSARIRSMGNEPPYRLTVSEHNPAGIGKDSTD